MTQDEAAVVDEVELEVGAAPPLPVLLRIPRLAEPPVAPTAPAAAHRSAPRKRQGPRPAARLALVLLLGATAAPWVIRLRPWERLGLPAESSPILHAGGVTAPPAQRSSRSGPLPAMEDPFTEQAQSALPRPESATPTHGARLVPDIVPIDGDKGGTR